MASLFTPRDTSGPAVPVIKNNRASDLLEQLLAAKADGIDLSAIQVTIHSCLCDGDWDGEFNLNDETLGLATFS